MCDDVNNNEACSFDGGDCCGSNVNTDWCTECLCLEGGVTTPSGSGGCSNWIGDLICDDVNNNEACSFDGGDCCGPNVNTDWCTACLCLEGGVTTTSPGSGGCSQICQ